MCSLLFRVFCLEFRSCDTLFLLKKMCLVEWEECWMSEFACKCCDIFAEQERENGLMSCCVHCYHSVQNELIDVSRSHRLHWRLTLFLWILTTCLHKSSVSQTIALSLWKVISSSGSFFTTTRQPMHFHQPYQYIRISWKTRDTPRLYNVIIKHSCYNFKALAPKQVPTLLDITLSILPFPIITLSFLSLLSFYSHSYITLSPYFISDLSASDSLSRGTPYR